MRTDLCRTAAQVAVGLWRPQRATAGAGLREEVQMMKRNTALFPRLALLTTLLIATIFSSRSAEAQGTGNTTPPRHITLHEAVQLALSHNHSIRIAGYGVEEKQHAKEVAKSSYFPSIRNDSNFMHVTDTQLI